MALTVNTNIPSLDAQRNVGLNNSMLGQSIERLSSGLRINKAADDAAGLAIATKMDAQVQGLNQAVRNANNAVSLVQTAEGGVNTLTDILQRLRELAVQASSADNTPSDRATTEQEAASLITEFTRVASTSQFNTMTLLDGSFTGKYFQIGANYGQTVSFAISDARGKSIGARAEYDAQIGGGVATATNDNFGAGVMKINGVDVAATSAEDDQYSVLDISSGGITSSAAVFDSGFVLWVNGTSVAVGLGGTLSNADASTIANAVQTAIIDASMTNITARAVGSTWVIEATGGTNLNLAAQGMGAVSAGLVSALGMGISGLVSMWGSGPASLAVGNYNGESGAIAKAVAINAVQGDSQVLATAQPNVVTAVNPVGQIPLAAGDVYINGYDIGAVTVGASDSTGALATAINTQTANTGVSASVNDNGKLDLTATDGRNITITTRTQNIGTTLGLKAADATNSTWLYRSVVRLDDPNSFTLTSASSLVNLTGQAGTTLSVASDVNTFNVANIELDTQDNAQSAILTIDSALNQVNNIRAGIGAIQNRLQFTVNNLQIASENMSASESRIKDADFASEVATFTRNQIMVQAGVAMVAQANTVSQYALQLLR
ncbi:MAG TPA: flagellin [Syntrophorhabdales bacterium]|nr:flagellin [Syntrophorhabdales bacterium]